MIDLRSDTVTQPTAGMLEAMYTAPLGDDVFAEDPSVIALECEVAVRFSQEAGLFFPSGTMANLAALKAHTQPFDEVLLSDLAHIYHYEVGGYAAIAGVSAKLLPGVLGIIDAHEVTKNIQPQHDWTTRTTLLAIENTVNKGGGSVYTLAQMQALQAVAAMHGVKYHLDGARIFNACLSQGYTTQQVGVLFDSISICFSKGLGAPVGSVLVGRFDFIKKCRRIRKALGGGMRQAGMLAAACSYSLQHITPLLAHDHRRTRQLEQVLQQLSYIEILLPAPTNILIFTLKQNIDANHFLAYLTANNIRAVSFGGQQVRFVLHHQIDDSMVASVAEVLQAYHFMN